MKYVCQFFLVAFLIGVPGLVQAQTEEEGDPFAALVFTPEEIMQHRRAIDLNDEQRDGITRLIEDLQGRLVALQWRLLDETESVREALEGPRVDLDRVMDRFGNALDTEMDIKRIHLELLIRIKNVLSPAQQEELLRLREAEPDDSESSDAESALAGHEAVEDVRDLFEDLLDPVDELVLPAIIL